MCNHWHKSTVVYCPTKGTHWQKAWDRSAQPQPARPYGGWDPYNFVEEDDKKKPKSKSPRPRRPDYQNRQDKEKTPKSKDGQNKDKEGKGKGKGKTKSPFHPEPPWNPFNGASSSTATNAQMPVVTHPAEKSLKELLTMLKKGQGDMTLSPEVLAYISSAQAQEEHAEEKALHSAVSKMGHARRTLQQARSAKSHLHAEWHKFVNTGVQRWKSYAELFQEQEQDLDRQIATALETLKAAKAHLTKTKAASVESVETHRPEDGGEISDEAFMETEPNSFVQEGMTTFIASLESIKKRADESVEQDNKRQKLAEEATPVKAEVPAPGQEEQQQPPQLSSVWQSKSTAPFGGPGS